MFQIVQQAAVFNSYKQLVFQSSPFCCSQKILQDSEMTLKTLSLSFLKPIKQKITFLKSSDKFFKQIIVVIIWKKIRFGSVTNRNGAENLSFYYLQTAVLHRSDTDSEGVEPTLGFVFPSRQTLCSMWCPMYGARY